MLPIAAQELQCKQHMIFRGLIPLFAWYGFGLAYRVPISRRQCRAPQGKSADQRYM